MKILKKAIAVMMACFLAISIPTPVLADSLYSSNSEDTVESITPSVGNTLSAEEFHDTNLYAIVVDNDAEKSATVPLVITQDGYLDYAFIIDDTKATGSFTYTISTDAEKQDVITTESHDFTTTSSLSNLQSFKKGTYYLTIDITSDNNTEDPFTLGFAGLLYTSSAKTLKNNKITVSAKSASSDYHKFTLTKSASIGFMGDGYYNDSTLKFTICDSNKKALTKQVSMNNSTAQYFSLVKGTYYLKVNTDSPIYQMLFSAGATTDKSGSTASKPASLKVNTKTLGLVTANDSKNKTDYYKITTTKAGQLKGLYVSYYGQGAINVKIKAPGIKDVTGKIENGMYRSFTLQESLNTSGQTYYRDNNFPKGTYTIQITKPDTSTTGVYEIGTKLYE